MKRVLVVAYYFPPIAVSGSLRPLGFCRYLESYGWLPCVLTTDPGCVYPPLGTDEELCSGLPHNLRIDRIPHSNPLQNLIAVRDRLRTLMPVRCNFNAQQVFVNDNSRTWWGSLKDLVLDRTFSFPDAQCLWLRPAVRRVCRFPEYERPDIVFATGSPWTGLLVGKAIAQSLGVPFIADFRDPWIGNPKDQYSFRYLLKKATLLEKSVCEAAARVIANTDELCARFRLRYSDMREKFVTVTNGFDCENGKPTKEDNLRHAKSAVARSGTTLELCHFGAVYGNRNPLPLFRAVLDLLNENQIEPFQIRLSFVGSWDRGDDNCEGVARALEERGILRKEPAIPHEECLRRMAMSDVLLVLQSAYPLQIPGKIYEYIAAARPILVIGGEGATAALVSRYGLGKCCNNDVATIKELFVNVIKGKITIPSPKPETALQFHYSKLTQRLAGIFAEVSTKSHNHGI